MPIVELSEQEWQQAIALIAEGPWKLANPLLVRMTNQLQVQQQPKTQPLPQQLQGNSGDVESAFPSVYDDGPHAPKPDRPKRNS